MELLQSKFGKLENVKMLVVDSMGLQFSRCWDWITHRSFGPPSSNTRVPVWHGPWNSILDCPQYVAATGTTATMESKRHVVNAVNLKLLLGRVVDVSPF